MTLDGAVDTPAFEAFVEQVLCPQLRADQVVLLDNLASHKGPRVRELIEERDCRLLFLPSYSPDFSPIEQALAKNKQALRRVGARTKEALEAAIAEAIELITPGNARAFFRHCGYRLSSQPL